MVVTFAKVDGMINCLALQLRIYGDYTVDESRRSRCVDSDDDDDEIAYFIVRLKTRASFVYRTSGTKNMR